MRLVKRVVGMPGDTIAMQDDVLTVNGTPLRYGPLAPGVVRDIDARDRAGDVFASEDLAGRDHAVMGIPGRPAMRDFGPVRVPEGSYFMMGDDRDNSADSRYFGFVPRARIVGKAEDVVFSVDLAHYARPRFDRFFSDLYGETAVSPAY